MISFERTNKNLESNSKKFRNYLLSIKKQLLFKIHGDLSDTKNMFLRTLIIIIFIENKAETVFGQLWNRLASLLYLLDTL
jgi:hypothetical protein